jgi:hypothetical protein
VVSGIGDRAGIENVGVDEAWKDAAAAKSFKLRMTMNLNEQWKNHKHLQMSPLFFAPPSFLQDFSSNITLLRHPLLCPVEWVAGRLPHFQFVQVATHPQKLRSFLSFFSLVARWQPASLEPSRVSLFSEDRFHCVNAWIAPVGGKWKYKGDMEDPEWGLDMVKRPSVRVGGLFLCACPSPCPLIHIQVCVLHQELACSRQCHLYSP